MAMKASLRDSLWLAAGAAIMLAITLAVLYLHEEQNPAAQLALKAKRLELVEQMRLALAWASEAEKSAVMAATDQDSQSFAGQSRAQVAAVERGRQELEGLLQTGGTKTERDLLAQFTEAFAEFQRINRDLLDMAVQNTNLKAFRLAFGPAAEVLTGNGRGVVPYRGPERRIHIPGGRARDTTRGRRPDQGPADTDPAGAAHCRGE